MSANCGGTRWSTAKCKAGAPAEFMHVVALGGGYGQQRGGTAIYYYCADCHDGVGHEGTDMSTLKKCVRRPRAKDDEWDACVCEHDREDHDDSGCNGEASSGLRCACPSFELQT